MQPSSHALTYAASLDRQAVAQRRPSVPEPYAESAVEEAILAEARAIIAAAEARECRCDEERRADIRRAQEMQMAIATLREARMQITKYAADGASRPAAGFSQTPQAQFQAQTQFQAHVQPPTGHSPGSVTQVASVSAVAAVSHPVPPTAAPYGTGMHEGDFLQDLEHVIRYGTSRHPAALER
jgi:hypothetical protein